LSRTFAIPPVGMGWVSAATAAGVPTELAAASHQPVSTRQRPHPSPLERASSLRTIPVAGERNLGPHGYNFAMSHDGLAGPTASGCQVLWTELTARIHGRTDYVKSHTRRAMFKLAMNAGPIVFLASRSIPPMIASSA
jgi:hypothetical protein